MSFLYCLENLFDGKKYVGYTCRPSIDSRINEHFKCAKRGADSHLYKAIRKYGKENFKWYVIYEGDDALEKEDGFIKLMGDYNMAEGGGKPPQHGKKTMLGKHHTSETKKRLSESNKGRKHTEYTKLLISMSNKGKPKSAEHKEKLRQSLTGKKACNSTKQKQSIIKSGKKQSLEWVEKRIARTSISKYGIDFEVIE